MGVSSHLVNLIWEMISTVDFRILLEGRKIGYVCPGRGLCQGDHISPYLFIFVLEAFHSMIQRKISEASITETLVLRNIIDTFDEVSGQTLNYFKSTLTFSKNVASDVKGVIYGIIGMREGNISRNYLGLPSLMGRNKREILSFIKEKILGRIKSWTNRFLSRAGKEILLKNVIQSMPNYVMIVFLIPVEMGRKIEHAMNGFLWGYDLRGLKE
ncbi:uncharacterized protein LOC116002292 [Ipomoea triloba]|uniref:uncharacterized protein LOC116002292 n=1 Tax=Ipomoea triloba TaxID=35885 RepID=UPI00125D9329|nr:uncharacterized protein LOC116002292 [Ipomoea triloba]